MHEPQKPHHQCPTPPHARLVLSLALYCFMWVCKGLSKTGSASFICSTNGFLTSQCECSCCRQLPTFFIFFLPDHWVIKLSEDLFIESFIQPVSKQCWIPTMYQALTRHWQYRSETSRQYSCPYEVYKHASNLESDRNYGHFPQRNVHIH